MRTTIEILHVLVGLLATRVFAGLAVWSYPLGARTIWFVSYAVMVIIVVLGIAPMMSAYRQDRERRG